MKLKNDNIKNTPANNNGCCPKCGSKDIGDDNLNWWCNTCLFK